jgi:NAD(P)-dependent dehydrogenase (short-subunit alcohol dehydrogenase family)
MMKRKMCVITGANSGIGKAAAVQINQAGYHVILACRNPSRGEAALEDIRAQTGNSAVELMIVDMSLQSSIKQFADTFQSKYKSLDVLIHNAAIFDITQKEKMITGEGVESIWATNHIGPVQLSDLLMEPLKQSQQGRIITVSSKGLIAYPFLKVDLEDPEFIQRKFSVQKAYYQSKLAQVMYTYWLADELKETKITANCIRVANVKIDIDTRYPNTSKFARSMYAIKSRFSISPEEMAETYTYLGVSDHIVGSSKYSRDSENINQVMALTRKYLHYWDGFFITDRV